MTVRHITPAEAKIVWHTLGNSSARSVADWFKAAGRPISHSTIWEWKRAGWPGTSAADIVEGAAAALASIDRVASVLSGDGRSTTADIAAAGARSPDTRSLAERAEDGLCTVIACAMTVLKDIATAQPEGDDAVVKGTPPKRQPEEADDLAKRMMAAVAAINMAIAGGRQLVALRIDEAAAMPGAQTLYPPGQGPYAQSSHADGLQGKQDYPARSKIEAVEQVLKEYRERKNMTPPLTPTLSP